MKPFSLAAGMTNMRGVFYHRPHGPHVPDAGRCPARVRTAAPGRLSEDDLILASPQEFERQITGATDEDDDMLLPSIGTEADTARQFRELAHQGHHALIVHASARLSSEHVLDLLRDMPISYGQRYRFLVMEDLVDRRP